MASKKFPQKENQPARHRWAIRHGTLAVIMGLLFVGVLIWAGFSSEGFRGDRVFGVAVVFLILGLALFDNLFEMLTKQRFWCQLAERTNLNCEVGNFFLGYPVQVAGQYRERGLRLYATKRGKGQVPLTRIDLRVENPVNAALRLRGPFEQDQAATDKIVTNLFGAADAKQFGDDRRFFIRSRPVHLVTTMFKAGPLRSDLLKLKPLSNIELDGQILSFEQIGILQDVDYLHFIFDLLSDLADAVDRGGYVKLMSSAAS